VGLADLGPADGSATHLAQGSAAGRPLRIECFGSFDDLTRGAVIWRWSSIEGEVDRLVGRLEVRKGSGWLVKN